MIKLKCDKCNSLISKNNYEKHIKVCDASTIKTTIKIKDEWKIDDDNYKCPFCDKTYTMKGIASHIWRNHTERGKNHNTNIDKLNQNKIPWNKGLTKNTDERVKKSSLTYINRMKSGEVIPSFTGKKHTEETKEKISKKLSKNNNGGRCKWFDYTKKDGSVVKLQGTWEVRFAKVLDVIDEKWIKINTNNRKHSFIWCDKDRKHYYTPDFYSKKLNKYFEVKGYWWGNDKEKMKQVILQNQNIKIEIIRKNDLLKYEKLIEKNGTLV